MELILQRSKENGQFNRFEATKQVRGVALLIQIDDDKFLQFRKKETKRRGGKKGSGKDERKEEGYLIEQGREMLNDCCFPTTSLTNQKDWLIHSDRAS